MSPGTRVRLCLKDLYAHDVVEMIERETRKYEVEAIESPDHPDFAKAYGVLWDAFGPAGEMESEAVIRGHLASDSWTPLGSGTFARYFLLVARDRETGAIRGVRDGRILVNPGYARDLCIVYLSHIFMLPEARGTVLTYWLRIAPVDLAVTFLHGLHDRGVLALPLPDSPGQYFGMRIDLAAEMEYFTPEDRLSLQRILFYGRGGFDVIDPRHFPYRQPDFRDPDEVRATGDRPIPFMLLLRRMGRERQAQLPLDEAKAVVRLLYDDFALYCEPQHLATSLDVVLKRLEDRRARGKSDVALLPLPTGPNDLRRLKPLFRYDVYRRYYGAGFHTQAYLSSGVAERIAANPGWFDDQLARIREQLGASPRWVYASRDKGYPLAAGDSDAAKPATTPGGGVN